MGNKRNGREELKEGGGLVVEMGEERTKGQTNRKLMGGGAGEVQKHIRAREN